MKRVLSAFGAGLVVASAAAAVVAVPAAAAPVAPAAVTAGKYVPLGTPQRAYDSRETGGAFGQGETRTVDLSTFVPPTATAVVLNLTETAPTAAGYLTVWPSDAPQPTASSLNKQPGETRSNSVTVALPTTADAARSVKVFNQAGSTQVVVDVFGWYDPSTTSGVSYYPQPGLRVFDSREPGPASGTYLPGEYVKIPTAWKLSGVTALALNVTAVTPDGPGYLTTWDGATDVPPGTSTVNYEAGRVTPNFTVVPVTSQNTDNGVINIFAVGNNVSDADIVVDVVGIYATSGQRTYSTSYVPVTPQRLSDTRQTGVLGPNQTYDTAVPGGSAAWAANLNVTAVEPTNSTYLTVYASDLDKPDTSTLNADPGDVVPNAAQPLLSVDGLYRVYNASGYVNVVADLQGTFVSDTTESGKAAPSALGSDAERVTIAPRRG